MGQPKNSQRETERVRESEQITAMAKTMTMTTEKERNETERNELYLFILNFLVECRLPFISFHFVSFDSYLWKLFLISLMEKLCKLLALCVVVWCAFFALVDCRSVSLSLMLTNYKHTRDSLPTRS